MDPTDDKETLALARALLPIPPVVWPHFADGEAAPSIQTHNNLHTIATYNTLNGTNLASFE